MLFCEITGKVFFFLMVCVGISVLLFIGFVEVYTTAPTKFATRDTHWLVLILKSLFSHIICKYEQSPNLNFAVFVQESKQSRQTGSR